jgi:uncharacterized protein (TIGR03382 family)
LRARLGAANRDNQAPSVGITAPAQSATVAAGFSITATATDNVAVTSVAFYLDGDLVGTSTAAPYRLATDPMLGHGAHTIVVEATDSDGNSATLQRDITVASEASAGSDAMGGCSTSGPPPLALVALVLVAVLARRRNRAAVE